jgi:hypothetical protein
MPDDIKTTEPLDKVEQPVKPRGAAKPLRARPLNGEVDHEALSREFMKRFPKLRAALAK